MTLCGSEPGNISFTNFYKYLRSKEFSKFYAENQFYFHYAGVICLLKNNRSIDIFALYRYNMATAYVLINCELGSEESIISQLKAINGVKEVHGTFGAYDILAKIESPTVEALREIITWKIRKIEKIRSTLTLMGIEGQS